MALYRPLPLPTTSLEQLRERGLYVSEPFPERHVAFPLGVRVGKFSTTPGNNQSGFRMGIGVTGTWVDGPLLTFYGRILLWRTRWVVQADPDVMGAATLPWFKHYWKSEEPAIADILDFYFGEPTRMNACIAANERRQRWWQVDWP